MAKMMGMSSKRGMIDKAAEMQPTRGRLETSPKPNGKNPGVKANLREGMNYLKEQAREGRRMGKK